MRRLSFIITFAVLIFSAGTALSQQGVTLKRELNSARECAICHYEMMEVFINGNKGTDVALFPVGKEVASERMCFSCHDGSVGDSRLRVWDHQAMAHKTVVGLKDNMTAPATLPLTDGKISCMTCHSAHGTSTDAEQRMSIEQSLFLRMENDKSQLCQACHTDKKGVQNHELKELDKAKSDNVTKLDGKVAKDGTMTCESCHSVHGAKSEKLTIAQTSDMSLCKVCHQEMFVDPKTGKKAMMPHVSYGQPVSPDIAKVLADNGRPLSDNKELVCKSCHNVHDAKGQSLLYSEQKGEKFCNQCHTDFNKIINSSHDLAKVKGYTNTDGKTVAETGSCGACHGGHKWRTVNKGEKVDMVTQICINCHKQGGPAGEKIIDISKHNHYIDDIDPTEFTDKQRARVKDLSKLVGEFLKSYNGETKALRLLMKDKEMSCITCHDIHNGSKLFMRQEIADGKLCVNCHVDQKSVVETPHGKGKLTDCTACHQLHNSNTNRLVRNIEDRNNGCMNCHSDAKKGALPQGMTAAMPKDMLVAGHGHPTGVDNSTIFPEPMFNQEGGKFSCVSCHDPHVSDNKTVMSGNFLRLGNTIKSTDDFCVQCHDKQKSVLKTSHATDPKKKEPVKNKDGKMIGTCESCHKVHNAAAKDGMPSVINHTYTTPDDLCLNCHKDGGEAKDKAVDIAKGHKIGKVDKKKEGIDAKFLTMDNGTAFLRCITCHEPHANTPKSKADGSQYHTFTRDFGSKKQETVCLSCHTSQVSIKDGGHSVKKFEGKTDEIKTLVKNNDQCGACHDIHNSDPKFLMAGANDTERCMNCHDAGKMSVKHISAVHKSEVDMKDKNAGDLPLTNNMITCVTCHETHKGSSKLIRGKSGKGEDLCIVCHTEQKDVILSKHNMRINGIKDDKLTKLAADNSCEPCHAAHDANSKTALGRGIEPIYSHSKPIVTISSNKSTLQEHCLTCHNTSGVAPEAVPQFLRHPSMMKALEKFKLFDKFTYDHKGKLSASGNIECATCHNPHVWSTYPKKRNEFNKAGLTIKGDNSTSFIKGGIDKEFCSVCHDDAASYFNKFHTPDQRDNATKKTLQPKPLLKRLIDWF